MKKILLCLLCLFSLVGCDNKNTQKNTEEDLDFSNYSFVNLRINMPLNYDDLDEYFEVSMIDEVYDNEIGEFTGDGTPLGEYGPMATDINFAIQKDKLSDFKKVIEKYQLPKGSYLEVDEKIDSEYGTLLGVRVVFKDMKTSEIDKFYGDAKSFLNGKYVYSTLINNGQDYVAYFYGKSRDIIKNELTSQISELKKNILLMDMSDDKIIQN